MYAERKAALLGLAAVGLWSTVATAFKLSLNFLSPAALTAWATLFSALALGLTLAVKGRLRGALKPTRAELRTALIFGALNPLVYYLILFKAYALLPAQEAQAINYTWAVTLSLLAVPLLGQRMGGRDLLALGLSYLGVLVIATRGDVAGLDFASPLGVSLALASTVIWALYWIFNTRDSRDPVAGLFWNFVCATPLAFGAAVLLGDVWPTEWQGLAGAAYVGCFEMGFTFVLWLSALKLTRHTARISNLIFLSPLVSLVLIGIILDEPILPSTLAGLGLILAGQGIQRLGRTA